MHKEGAGPPSSSRLRVKSLRKIVDLDLSVLYGTGQAEAHVQVRGSVGRAPCGLNFRLPDTHITAAAISGVTLDMLEALLRPISDDSQRLPVEES